MKKHLIPIAVILLCAGSHAQEAMENIDSFASQKLNVPMRNNLGAQLIKADGSTVPSEELDGKMVGLLFSGSWTDLHLEQIKDLYASLQQEGKPFEVVWVSNDLSEQDMMQFMQKQDMPWPAVQFDRLRALNLRFQYSVRYDPTLIIINSAGAPFTLNAIQDIAMLGGDEAYARWQALRPIPFEGQMEVSGDFRPKAPVTKDPIGIDDLLAQRSELAGDVVELMYNNIGSIQLSGAATYTVHLRYHDGSKVRGSVAVEASEEGYAYFTEQLRRGEQRRNIYVQVTQPGFPMRALGNDYSKKHNEYEWE